MTVTSDPSARDRWARLRFAIIGPLLAAPPEAGALHAALKALAAKVWRHPLTGLDLRCAASTLERWYYVARGTADPVAALQTRLRGNVGRFPSLSPAAIAAVRTTAGVASRSCAKPGSPMCRPPAAVRCC